jgi:selenocysteine lyase/cysteine desulfurase
MVAQGFPWEPGDNVVIDDQEHPVNVVPWLNLRRRGVEVRVAATQERRVTLTGIWSRVDAHTRIIAVSHVQYSTGMRADVQALAARCREHGITLVVDGVQAAGLLPVDADGWGIDALACGVYKALLGPLGLGFLHLSPELLEKLRPAHLGASAVNRVVREGPEWRVDSGAGGDARVLEGGNINYPAIYGLAQALRLIEQARIDRLAPWVLDLGARLDAALRSQGYELLSSAASGENSFIVCLRHPQAFALRKYLYMEGVVANLLDTGAVRLSFGGYNTPAEVDRIIDITGRFARDAALRRHLLLPTAGRPY